MVTPDFAPLRTTRLTIRPLALEDAPAIHRLVNDWEVAKELARVPFPYPQDAARQWIESSWVQFARSEACHLAVIAEIDDAPIMVGAIGLTFAPDGRSADLGYWIGRRFWGRGYAPEAAAALSRWAFAERGLVSLKASALLDNPRSQAVLTRLGLKRVGEGIQPSLARGRPMPVALFEGSRADLAPPPALPLLLVAAVALIDADGRVLLAQRPPGKPLAGLWEFPGGKVQAGETPEAALIRELKEELDIDVHASCLGPFTFASHAYEKFHLLMPLYLCRRWEGQVTPVEGQQLAWVAPMQLGSYPMPPADKPLVAMLQDFL
jgi:8-oxo-dGTP diphosphatase